MDLSQDNLGLTPARYDDLLQNLNIIINSAGNIGFDTRLDIATELHVRGPLLLLKLAEQCPNFEAFCQISTLFAVSDKTGFIEEKYNSDSEHDWQSDYERIRNMSRVDLL